MTDEHTLSFILNHLGEDRESYRGAVTPPIFETSNFAFPTVAAMRAAGQDELATAFYTRGNNPTVEILRRKLAALEGTEDALVFGSGAGAIAAGVLAAVRAGDHVLCVQKPYAWTRVLVRDWLPRFGVSVSFVDGGDVAAIEAALTERTRMIVLESPNSLTMELQDLAAIAALAKTRGVRTLCDNSYASPLLQRPADLGIDLVMHSATKYLNGHSDVVAGVLCASRALIQEVFRGPFMTFGAIPGPFEAWLMLRGLRTLGVRMERVVRTTARIVEYLQQHPKIARVYYPGSNSDPQRELAQAQMRSGSGMLAIEVKAEDVAGIERFCDSLKLFLMAVSWGGHESLVWPLAVVIRDGKAESNRTGLPWNLVRLSIGLEEPEDLMVDLEQALAKA
ncbi:MAG: aminotransferase class I/II-fold pyridoxal phosphate-dependent enzyme [Rhodanobacteraceae bacterium]|nr:aminotransferase class I/II-fold pyridoxal phosphate-dependent enzyme [Rhodanobacteraceae bacterium]